MYVTPPPPRSATPVYITVALWFVAAFIIAALGALARLPVPPPAIAFILAALLLAFLLLNRRALEHVRAAGVASLVGFHLSRLAAGAYFLVLESRGILRGEFARFAGWGDILVGLGVLPVVWFCSGLRTRSQRFGLLVWNVIGLIDILAVLGNGIRLFIPNPAIAEPFTRLPLALLPLFVVPIVLVTHVLLFLEFRRLARDHSDGITRG
jgi:hypothetical protein